MGPSMKELRQWARSLGPRIVYRADRFLSYPPLIQVLVLVGLVTTLVCLFAVVGSLWFWATNDERSASDALYWSLAMMLDGGSMTAGQPFARSFSLVVTISGVFALSFLTGAFASSMSARLEDLREGKSSAPERGHVVILGFDAHVTFLARELAHWEERLVVVTLAQEDKGRIDRALKPARFSRFNRGVRFVVRHGDPRSEAALARVAVDRSRGVVVVPPAHLDDEATIHWTLSTLLALRRAAGPRYRGKIVVEVRQAAARRVLDLVAEPDLAGPGRFDFELVASDDVLSRVLAQSARHTGIYHALRELASFEGNEIRSVPMVADLVGRTLDDVHRRVEGAIVIGVVETGRTTHLVPESPSYVVAASDRLLVVSERRARIATRGKLPPRPAPAATGGEGRRGPERVLVIGQNRSLPLVLRELDLILPRGSQVVVMGAADEGRLAALFDEIRPSLDRIRLSHDPREPLEMIEARDESLARMDAILVLGCEDDRDDGGDGRALATLLLLRHTLASHPARRIVTEVRDAHSARTIASRASDVLVSTDVIAMLLARAVMHPETRDAYRELLNARGFELCLRPRSDFAGEAPATFGEVMAGARARDELAIGLFFAGATPSAPGIVRLNPRRNAEVPTGPGTMVVVLAKPDPEDEAPLPPPSSADPGLLL